MIRERCTIRDEALGNVGSHILSNRLSVPIGTHTLNVRGQNMHSVTRLAARLFDVLVDSKDQKTIAKPDASVLKGMWDGVADDVFNNRDGNWASAYLDGELIFASDKHHPFLDLIEKQVGQSEASYDMNVMITAENFNAAGFPGMSVEHDTNVALVLTLEKERGRSGLIYRHPQRTTTFSYSLTPQNQPDSFDMRERVPAILEMAADFLESIQLCYASAAEGAKGLAQDGAKVDAYRMRLGDLHKSIDGFEEGMHVAYRPERPNFTRFLQEAQMLLVRRSRA